MARTSTIFPPPQEILREIVRIALSEDLLYGDITSNLLIDDAFQAQAQIIAKEPMVVAGVLVALEAFHQVDSSLRSTVHINDGQWISKPSPVITLTGSAHSILQSERVALNFLQRLSGISTLTHQCRQAMKGNHTILTDTRKTTPGLRVLEKWAVRLGGGHNHRSSLHDGVLIKDNHLTILAAHKIGITQACLQAKTHAPHGLKISVEVETLIQVKEALDGHADIILLDNMSPEQVKKAIDLIQGKALTEVSGGVTLKNIRAMAMAKPDFISVGALTHSAPAMDFTMKISSLSNKRRSTKFPRSFTR